MKGFAGAFQAISGWLYIVLMTNLLLALTCLPLWLLAVFVDLRQSWLWLALTSLLGAPALAGAYAVFRDHFLNESYAVIKPYFAAWAGSWRRLWPLAPGFSAFFCLVLLDLYVVTLWGYGLLGLPVSVVLVGLGLAVVVVAWEGLAVRADLSRLDVLKASLYLSLRRGGWSLVSLAVLIILGATIWRMPAIGLGVLATPALYVVWANSRRVLAEYLPGSQLRDIKEGAE